MSFAYLASSVGFVSKLGMRVVYLCSPFLWAAHLLYGPLFLCFGAFDKWQHPCFFVSTLP